MLPFNDFTPPIEETPLEYIAMPQEMATFRAPLLPEPETIHHLKAARALMNELAIQLKDYRIEQSTVQLSLDHLDAENLKLVVQTLAEGEVKIIANGQQSVRFQESVLAGIWLVQCLNEQGQIKSHWVEIGAIPELVRHIADTEIPAQLEPFDLPDNLMNAPAILTEIIDKQSHCQHGDPAHIINLTLLPISETDQTFLLDRLGTGCLTILSKGYGNCRISSANLQRVWWVRYYNSMDQLILNTLEITSIPSVACAAQEDIEDSYSRLMTLLNDYLKWG
jgi:hydrogenase-1 operon protein HyaF